MSASPNAGCHAVLAFLSERYPPLEGRSPTCYSPVCHSTQGLRPFRVRLACVRHAASVDSEPGSNSQVKGVGHPFRASQSLTRAPVDDLALHVVQFVKCIGGSQPATVGELHPLHRIAPRHPLILDGSPPVPHPHPPLPEPMTAEHQQNCACTFYLVFKEPDLLAVPRRPTADWGTLQSYSALTTLSTTFAPSACFFPAALAGRSRALPARRRVIESGSSSPGTRAGKRLEVASLKGSRRGQVLRPAAGRSRSEKDNTGTQ